MTITWFRSANRDYWDGKAGFNLASWDVDGFVADPARLSTIVAADRDAVGDVRGRTLLHLQCHFGMDTLAWARLGAEVTGVDFSPRAISAAIDLAARAGLAARFVEADLYAVPEVLPEAFDVVYTGGGALCWLPDTRGWAQVVGRMLRPGGTFYIHEAHPVLWSLEDEREDSQLVIGRPYFEMAEPMQWDAAPIWDKPSHEVTTALRVEPWPGRDRGRPDRGRPHHRGPARASDLPVAGAARSWWRARTVGGACRTGPSSCR